MQTNMHIIHITSELAKVAKVGGLADVVYGLSQELSRLGHTVEVILPKYDCLDYAAITELKTEQESLCNSTIWSAKLGNFSLVLIESQHYFHRGKIYGCQDDTKRFLHFCAATTAYLRTRHDPKAILHLHDWPTGAIPAFCKQQSLTNKIVFTIHNLEHQGWCNPHELTSWQLDPTVFQLKEGEFANLLKGAVVLADEITTVSPTYEKEIQTPEKGCGLDHLFQEHKEKLQGILNGIDEDFWNPAIDPHLITPFSTLNLTLEQITNLQEKKRENLRYLRTHLGLAHHPKPVVAAVTRLVSQKAPQLLYHALKRTLEKGGQFILLGSLPTQDLQEEFFQIQESFQHHPDVSILMDQDEALAHLIFAATDFLIIPSLFEPCGLTQMISLRYASIPIARLTGGLIDTVFDIDTSDKPVEERNGFTFTDANPQGVNWALDRALEHSINKKETLQKLILQGTQKNFSWKHAAPAYLALYSKKKP